jgi:hypothetical protein
MEMKEE